jgi:hypothetical protein
MGKKKKQKMGGKKKMEIGRNKKVREKMVSGKGEAGRKREKK